MNRNHFDEFNKIRTNMTNLFLFIGVIWILQCLFKADTNNKLDLIHESIMPEIVYVSPDVNCSCDTVWKINDESLPRLILPYNGSTKVGTVGY